MALRRFVAIRGYTCVIYSDNGSELRSASKEMKSIIKGLDWEELNPFGIEKGPIWKFISPDAPWHNGYTESLIKSTKKAMIHSVGNQVLSFSELQTVFYEVSNLLNERPIGKHPVNPEDGAYICPNGLLLGRSTDRVPSGPFKKQSTFRQRFELVQGVTDAFWKKMTRDYFPSLVIRQKWHTLRRKCVCWRDSHGTRQYRN